MRAELSYGSLLGGVMLALLDSLSLNFPFYGAELPVGMISSVLGSFVLIFLLSRNYFKSLQK
jgi:ABC-type Fe3+-siderophore transport system permease subunit